MFQATDEQMLASVRDRIRQLHEYAPDSIGDRMGYQLISCTGGGREYFFQCRTFDWMRNAPGTLHGGMASTMMDLTMSMAVYCFSRQTIPPTISMTTNYLRPVPMEDSVLIRARLTSLGKRNATAYCEAIVPATGKVACTAIGTYAIIPKK